MKWKTKNPLVKPSFRQWWAELMCEWFGHKTVGDYYRMPQAHCGDCGAFNKGLASKGCPDWIKPDYLD